jgi:hypothetical protein
MNAIQPNFIIPADYERVFGLRINGLIYLIFVDRGGIYQGQVGECEPCRQGDVLDWIHETIERIRWECENES